MAQKKNGQKQTETVAKESKGGLIKVKINSVLRGSYGAFNPGQIAELEKTLAESFVKEGYAQKVD